jgi:hypothetical protein
VAIAERASDLDPRLWLNGAEIAKALQRPDSTVYSALAAFVRASQKVGGQRRYSWTVCLELCRAYAVPLSEFAERVRPVLFERAEERGNDPRDVLQLFEVLMRRWVETRDDPKVTQEMIERLRMPSGRLDPDVVAAARLLPAIEDGPDAAGPSRLPDEAA